MNLVDRVIAGFGAEDAEHYALVQWCEIYNIDVFHVPNSTWTKSVMVRTRNRLLGVRAGVPDLFIPIAGVGLLVIELKRPYVKGQARGRVSPAQQTWLDKLNQVPGVAAYTCFGASEAVDKIRSYLPHPPKAIL